MIISFFLSLSSIFLWSPSCIAHSFFSLMKFWIPNQISYIFTSFQFGQKKLKPHNKKRDPNRPRRPCVRCPGEITAIARKGLDGILLSIFDKIFIFFCDEMHLFFQTNRKYFFKQVEPPAPLSCKTNLPFARNLYRIETLFGSDFSFVLPEGKHTLTAKVRNVESGLIVRSCLLKYHVIVRRCEEFPRLKNRNLKVSCTAGTVWGSQCAFECKKEGESLNHREPIVCNEDLEWFGDQPKCVSDIGNWYWSFGHQTFFKF